MRQILFSWLCIVILLVGSCIYAQCPEGDIQLNNQAEVNQFTSNYPGCTQLQGRFLIFGSDVTNLSPLSSITSTNGLIIQNTGLVTLTGLENLTTINGQLTLSNNNLITSFEGLGNVTQVTELNLNSNPSLVNLVGLNGITTVSLGRMQINWNNALQSITGLQNLTTVAGNFEIMTNPLLTDLSGLSSLQSTGGLAIQSNNSLQNLDDFTDLNSLTGVSGLRIAMNPALTSLEGLLDLTNLGNKSIQVTNNASLTSLYGLDNVQPATISNLSIQSSQQLSTCNIPSICDYLSAGGTATITGNSVGCASVPQVLEFCEGFSECPTGDVTLATQAEVNLFLLQYPDCTTIQGNLFIGSETEATDITNLISLQNIVNVVGKVTVKNTFIENMTGLHALAQIGGGLNISDNSFLESLTALSNLTTISGSELAIVNNDLLSSLTGLDNLDPTSISHLILESSQSLTTCDIESICTYISSIGATYSISGNATGCNSFQEVLDACQDTLPTCPEGDIEFLTQAEVDHFSIQYPNCESLSGALKIGGVNDNDINNLLPLQNITSAKGAVVINKTSLVNLQGLNSLQSIPVSGESNSSLEITFNSSLTSLEGLENFTTSNNIFIMYNPSLTSLQGLSGLTGFEGVISISNNETLPNLSGLGNLIFCYKLDITGNDNLETLEGLNNLENIFGDFTLNENIALSSLAALSKLESIYGPGDNGFGGWMRIQSNHSLINLDGLNNLSALNGIQISNNENLENISALSSLTIIDGEEMGAINQVNIGGNNSLKSLHGLHNITSIGYSWGQTTGELTINNNPALEDVELTSLIRVYNSLDITSNPSLTSLDGLINLKRIDADLSIVNNSSLTSLDGLNGLTHFGVSDGWFNILTIKDNASLENIEGLSNLSNILAEELNLIIQGNPQLTSLSGLENINSSSIDPYAIGIALLDNAELSECHITPVCEWLSGGGLNEINNNATGCNSSSEILELCQLSIEEINDSNQITLYPVPTKQILNISVQNAAKIESVNVYDMTGKLVLSSNNSESKINLSHLNSGTYLVSVKTNKGTHTEKIIKK